MKVEVKDQETFKPITIELVIESEEELCDLWHRINATSDCFDKPMYSSKERLEYSVLNHVSHPLFTELNDLVERYNLKNK